MTDFSTTEQLWDQSVALSNVGGEVDDLKDLLQMWIEQSATLLSEMESAHLANDAGRLHLSAHTLKSSLQLFGMQTCGELTAALEMAGRTQQTDQVAELLQLLRSTIARVIPQVQTFVDTH